jgi:hypothetical protein
MQHKHVTLVRHNISTYFSGTMQHNTIFLCNVPYVLYNNLFTIGVTSSSKYTQRGWSVTRGLRVVREQLFLRLLLTTCRASEYTLDLESCLGTLRQS